MNPQEIFHDHPVIDVRDDGIYLYFHELPSILLNTPICYSQPDDDQTTD